MNDVQSWKNDLHRLMASAETEEDRIALEAFARAVEPALDDPRKLQTMLSKIQKRILSGETQEALDNDEFATMADLVAIMPSDVSVRLESAV